MSGEPNAESGGGQEGFTCCALLMCLYLPGLSKKKPEEATDKNPPPAETGPAPGPPTEQQAPSRAASLYSGNNIDFDFAVEEGDQEEQGAARAIQFQGYCPSPCFDLPLELIRAGERSGAAAASSADSDEPVTAALVFGGDGQRAGALKKMASCLAPGVEGSSEPEPRPPHLLRFLSASGRCSSVPRPPVMPSRTSPLGKAVEGDCDLGESMMVPACNE